MARATSGGAGVRCVPGGGRRGNTGDHNTVPRRLNPEQPVYTVRCPFRRRRRPPMRSPRRWWASIISSNKGTWTGAATSTYKDQWVDCGPARNRRRHQRFDPRCDLTRRTRSHRGTGKLASSLLVGRRTQFGTKLSIGWRASGVRMAACRSTGWLADHLGRHPGWSGPDPDLRVPGEGTKLAARPDHVHVTSGDAATGPA